MSIKAKWTTTLALAIATIPPGLAQTNDPGIEQAKVILATKLKDGASARFLGVVHAPSKSGGAGIVCGWVNAKNSFGGYVGYKPFVVSGDTVMIRDESQDQFNNKSIFDMYWFHGCFPDTNEQIGDTVVQLSKINIAKQCAKLRKSLPEPSNESHCEDTEARAQTWLQSHPTAKWIADHCAATGREYKSYNSAQMCVEGEEADIIFSRGPTIPKQK
jgi:hypothetical protein